MICWYKPALPAPFSGFFQASTDSKTFTFKQQICYFILFLFRGAPDVISCLKRTSTPYKGISGMCTQAMIHLGAVYPVNVGILWLKEWPIQAMSWRLIHSIVIYTELRLFHSSALSVRLASQASSSLEIILPQNSLETSKCEASRSTLAERGSAESQQ